MTVEGQDYYRDLEAIVAKIAIDLAGALDVVCLRGSYPTDLRGGILGTQLGPNRNGRHW